MRLDRSRSGPIPFSLETELRLLHSRPDQCSSWHGGHCYKCCRRKSGLGTDDRDLSVLAKVASLVGMCLKWYVPLLLPLTLPLGKPIGDRTTLLPLVKPLVRDGEEFMV